MNNKNKRENQLVAYGIIMAARSTLDAARGRGVDDSKLDDIDEQLRKLALDLIWEVRS